MAKLDVISWVVLIIPAERKFVEMRFANKVPVLMMGAAIMLLGSRIQMVPVLGRADAGIELSGKNAAMLDATIFPSGILDNSLPSPTNFVARRIPILCKDDRGIVLAPNNVVDKNPYKAEVGTEIPAKIVPVEVNAFRGIDPGANTDVGSVLNKAAVGTETSP